MSPLFVFSACLVLPLAIGGEPPVHVTFIKADLGKLPDGWDNAQTGLGTGSVWKVMADGSAPSKSGFVLAQIAEGPKPLFNLAVLKKSRFYNGSLSVQFKSMQGKIDQGGGVVWRYQDANNYYICRYNPLEDNFRVYKVLDGKRTQLATKESLVIPAGEWHSLSVTQEGKRIRFALDGKVLLEVEDESITQPGKVGLWTKADAQTYFDVLTISAGKE